jgi:hypothetical protein
LVRPGGADGLPVLCVAVDVAVGVVGVVGAVLVGALGVVVVGLPGGTVGEPVVWVAGTDGGTLVATTGVSVGSTGVRVGVPVDVVPGVSLGSVVPDCSVSAGSVGSTVCAACGLGVTLAGSGLVIASGNGIRGVSSRGPPNRLLAVSRT